MLAGHGVRHGVHRRAGQLGLPQGGLHLKLLPLGGNGLQLVLQATHIVVATGLIGHVQLVLSQVGHAQSLAELLPLAVGGDAHGQETILGLQGIVGRDGGIGVAGAGQHLAVDVVHPGAGLHHGEQAVQLG